MKDASPNHFDEAFLVNDLPADQLETSLSKRTLVSTPERFMHRYVMHKRIDVWALRAIHERHTRQHHQYFTDVT